MEGKAENIFNCGETEAIRTVKVDTTIMIIMFEAFIIRMEYLDEIYSST